MAETGKARARREREGFFEKYLSIGSGIDIGCGDDPVTPDCERWDKDQGDATFMNGVTDQFYDWVYSSHCLEHVLFPGEALYNWFRILRRGGFLILFLPHRDRYEKSLVLPSRFNPDHKTYWLPDRHEPPCTVGLVPLLAQFLDGYEMIYCKVCDDGWFQTPAEEHAQGEYSIECVIRKM